MRLGERDCFVGLGLWDWIRVFGFGYTQVSVVNQRWAYKPPAVAYTTDKKLIGDVLGLLNCPFALRRPVRPPFDPT
jgi:hypothetical protein